MNRFQRAAQELVDVAGQELGTGSAVGRVNVDAPAFVTPRVDLRLHSGGDHVLVNAGTKLVRHEGSRLGNSTGTDTNIDTDADTATENGIIRGTSRSCAILGCQKLTSSGWRRRRVSNQSRSVIPTQ